MQIRRILFALAVVAAGLLGNAAAVRADDVEDGQKLIASAIDEAIGTFQGKTYALDERDAKLRALIGKFTDVPMLSKDILGRFWARSTPEQQAEFPKLIVDYAIGSWGNQVANISSKPRIDFTASEQRSDTKTIVLKSQLVAGTDVTPVDWTLAKTEAGRLVIADAQVGGVSPIRTMREDFGAVLRANGGKIDALMDLMRGKITGSRK